MKNRISLVASAVAAVALWIVGLVLADAIPTSLSDNASDGEVLAWVQHNAGTLIAGAWLFMLGCVAFLVFAGILRDRLAGAEGGNHLLANLAFGGAIAAAVCAVGTNADITTAINKDTTSPAAAAAFHHIGDLFFMGAEVMLIAFVGSASVLAWRSGVLPRWWAVFGMIVAVVLAIGPIGWAALIFGTPIWVLGTSLLAGRRSLPARAYGAATSPSL
jgi:hypothetical protein